MSHWFDEIVRHERLPISFNIYKVKEEMKMKFKVGDKVRVRECLIADKKYNGCRFAPEMEIYKGRVFVIEYVTYYDGTPRYGLKGISYYHFSDDMLEPAEFTIDDLQVNDIVTFREGDIYMIHELNDELFGIADHTYNPMKHYKENLKHNNYQNLDIMRVRRPEKPGQLKRESWEKAPILWERKEKPYDGKSYEELHRELWNWLADNPTKSKRAWFEEFYPDEKAPLHFCFACEYAKNNTMASDICKKCPICDYKESSKCLNGLYEAWSTLDYSRQLGIKSDIARGIANLKWEDKNGKK